MTRCDGQRLIGCEDDGLALVRNGDRAERFLHGQLELGRKIVERDELLIGDERQRNRSPAVTRNERQTWSRALAEERGRQHQTKREE